MTKTTPTPFCIGLPFGSARESKRQQRSPLRESRALPNRYEASPHYTPTTKQAEALKTFAKVALSQDGADAVWAAGAVLPTVRALGLYLNDADVQHWGVATARALTGCDNRCEAWRGAGACEAVVRALIAFGKDGTGRHARHDEAGLGRRSESRRCTAEESLCVQFQACAAAFNLAVSSPDARRRIVREGAGQALAGMMRDNSSDIAAQRGALAALAALSASGAENRKRLHR